MLLTEQNTKTVERKIRSAARQRLGRRRLQADFEHGHWWLTDLDTGAQWSVCDEASVYRFCFEQVTEGEG